MALIISRLNQLASLSLANKAFTSLLSVEKPFLSVEKLFLTGFSYGEGLDN